MAAVGLHEMLSRLRVSRAAEPQDVVEPAGSAPADPASPGKFPAAMIGTSKRTPRTKQHLSLIQAHQTPEECDTFVDCTMPALSKEEAAAVAAFHASLAVQTELPSPELLSEQPTEAPLVPLSAEEELLLSWFRESHPMAKDAVKTSATEDYVWVDMPLDDDVVTVEMTQERMQEIGFVYKDGQIPTRESPARLYWIQDKPSDLKNHFGAWDPVGAQWKMYPERTVVPVEQRIAPMKINDSATFTGADYGDDSLYDGTAMEVALPHIRAQLATLDASVQLPCASGWGAHSKRNEKYYTPHLRQLKINSAIPEAPGKKYVYQVGQDAKPVTGKAAWNATNSCFVYAVDAIGTPLPEESGCGSKCCDTP